MKHGIAGFLSRQALVVHAKRHEKVERCDKKMPTATTRVQHREFFEGFRPSSKPTCCRATIFSPSEIRHFDRRLSGGHTGPAGWSLDPAPGTPPRADRVVQQELHHVVFGKEWGNRGERVPVDLLAALVDFVFPLGLPELIHPAKAV